MTRVLVLSYSSYGHVRACAGRGRRRAFHARHPCRPAPCALCLVPETVPDEVRHKAGFAPDDTPVATPAYLEADDAIIFGTPTLFGMMAGKMQSFLDQAGGGWARNALVDKFAAVFTSTGSQHGGHKAALL